MKNIPKVIYLQVDPEHAKPEDFSELAGVTWAENKIHSTDLEYHFKDTINIQYAILKDKANKASIYSDTLERTLKKLVNMVDELPNDQELGAKLRKAVNTNKIL